MSYSRRCPTCYGDGKMFYGRCNTCDGLGQVGYLSTDFNGLMGMTEMECAVAVMLNLAQQRAKPFSTLLLKLEDFKADGFERDGLLELWRHGWLKKIKCGSEISFCSLPALVARVAKRAPSCS